MEKKTVGALVTAALVLGGVGTKLVSASEGEPVVLQSARVPYRDSPGVLRHVCAELPVAGGLVARCFDRNMDAASSAAWRAKELADDKAWWLEQFHSGK